MWPWILGAGVIYGVYKLFTFKHDLVASTTQNLITNIRRNRDKARQGDKSAVSYLKDADRVLGRMADNKGNADGQAIVAAIKEQGLYPPSAI